MTLSVVSHYNFEETCILLESPFHAELNGLCSNCILVGIDMKKMATKFFALQNTP